MFRLNYLRLVKLPLMLFLLAACPNEATTARECETNTSSCIHGRPAVCLSTGRWRDTNPMEPCAPGTACCLINGVDGRPIHSCAPADGSACLPETVGQPTYAPPGEPLPTARLQTLGGSVSPSEDAR